MENYYWPNLFNYGNVRNLHFDKISYILVSSVIMVFLSLSWLLVVTIVFLFWKYSIRKFDYWKERGVHYIKPSPVLGNLTDVLFFRKCLADWMISLYASTNEKMFGIFIFDEPLLVVRDPVLIQHILIKDFNHFTDRTPAKPHDDVMSSFTFLQKSPEWKSDRAKLTPIFTSAKLKGFFPLINNICSDLVEYLSEHLGDVEMKEVCAKYSTDVIAKCVFGIDAYSFEDEDADFRKYGNGVTEFTFRNALAQFLYYFRPELVDTFRVNFIPKYVIDYFHKAFSNSMQTREESNIKVNDFVDILIELKNSGGVSDEIAYRKASGQALMFFSAGFETSSGTISFTLHELCLNKDIQNKLREEIAKKIEKHGGITYEAIQDMKYLKMCINETLRKYPILSFLDRKCNADYELPGTDLVIEKGMPIYIPYMAIQRDEKYFPDPQKYDPERFSGRDHNVDGLVFLPFGAGPRNCLGERFGLLSTQLALIHILLNFEVEKCAATPVPVQFETKSFINQSRVGLPMRLRRFNSKETCTSLL
ncbi:hypothetical protein JTB14_001761 [Gonioctena quinquepunctata]|nr:hypothetical protein JTB14_001761 [Gonioctena quinquepunctata]